MVEEIVNPITTILLTRGLWIILASAILLVIALMTSLIKSKQGRMVAGWLALGGILIVIIPVIVVPEAGISQWFGKTLMGKNVTMPIAGENRTIFYSIGSQPQPSYPSSNGNIACRQTDPATITLSAVDKYLTTSVGGTHRYRVNGGPASTVSDAGTFTASPGDSIDVLWGNGTLTGYYSKLGTYQVPCKATFTPKEGSNPVSLINNGSLTITFFNDPNGQPIDGATNQTLSAGDIKNVKTTIQGTYQKDFPYGTVVVIELNKTSIDNVVLSDRATAVELQSVSVPQTFSPTYGTDSTRKAYLIPIFESNKQYEFTTMIDADDTINPVSLGSGIGSDVLFTFFPQNLFVDDKDGGKYKGPSADDEYNVATRTGQITSTLDVQ